MIATERADGTYVLGDSHGDLADDRVEPSRAWCHGDDRKPETVERAMWRRGLRKKLTGWERAR